MMLSTPFIVYMCVSGWACIASRTRSMTIAQFLETRYSRNLRLMAGILSWLAGMINFGIFPAVSARLFMSIIGLPEHFHLGGSGGSGGMECSTFVALNGVDGGGAAGVHRHGRAHQRDGLELHAGAVHQHRGG